MSGLIISIGSEVKGALKGIEDVSLSLKEQKAVLASLQKEYAKLSTEAARSKIGKDLAADVRIAKDEVARLSAGATSSFGAVGTGATKALSAVRQFAYVLPGIGVAGIIGGLADMVVGLLSASEGFSNAALAAGHFSNEMKASKEALDAFESSLDFSGKIEKLQLELQGFSGFNLKAGSAGIDIKNNSKDISEISKEIDKLTLKNADLKNEADRSEREFVKLTVSLTKYGEAVTEFGSIEAIPKNIVSKLNSAQRGIVEQYQETNDRIKELDKKRTGLIRDNAISTVEISVDMMKEVDKERKKELAEQKRISALSKSEYDKYVNDIISKGKSLAGQFKDVGMFPSFSELDTKSDQFQKAKKALSDLRNLFSFKDSPLNFKIGVDVKNIQFPPEDVKTVATEFNQMFFSELKENAKLQPLDFSIVLAAEIDKVARTMGDQFAVGFIDMVHAGLKKGLKLGAAIQQATDLTNLAKSIDQQLQQIAVSGISSIAEGIGNALVSGDLANGFKGFADVIATGFIQIGKEMIAAAPVIAALKVAIKTLNPAILLPAGIALVAIGAALKASVSGVKSGRAAGGGVSAGQPYTVGERGREVFVPSTSGRIIPNNRLGSVTGQAASLIQIQLQGSLGFREIVLGVQRELRTQGRAT